jgi:hypothetical protein
VHDIDQRYSDIAPTRLRTPVRDSFAAWKTAAWFERHAQGHWVVSRTLQNSGSPVYEVQQRRGLLMESRPIIDVGVEVYGLQPIALAIAGHLRIAFLEDLDQRFQVEVSDLLG